MEAFSARIKVVVIFEYRKMKNKKKKIKIKGGPYWPSTDNQHSVGKDALKSSDKYSSKAQFIIAKNYDK